MARSAGLDRAAVIHAAAALADQHGIDQLTLAQLAAQLHIRTPSLYNHVDGLAGLWHELALLGGQQLVQRIGKAAIGRAGDTALLEIAWAYRAYVREHPGLYDVFTKTPVSADPRLQSIGQELIDILLAVLAGYNLNDEAAIHAVRGLRSIVHGFATLEHVGAFAMPLDRDESFRQLVQAFTRGLHALT